MKLFFVFIIAISYARLSQAQIPVVPATSNRPIDTLRIGFNTTTVLLFDASILDADRGAKDIAIQKQPSVTNVLNIKARRRHFQPTNLHVYTRDGKVFTFPVCYTDYPQSTTIPVSLSEFTKSTNSLLPYMASYRATSLNETQLFRLTSNARQAPRFFNRSTREQQMVAKLRTIHYTEDLLCVSIEIKNRSSLPYDMEFSRMYVQDKEKIKRATIQQREMRPVYQDSVMTIQPGHPVRYVLVVPKFTLDKNKEFLLEIFERNGGRHLRLEIKNRDLLRAKPWKDGD